MTGNHERDSISRRNFLKLFGVGVLSGLSGFAGYRVLSPGVLRKQTPTGYATATEFSTNFDSDAALDSFSNISHGENIGIVDSPSKNGSALEVRFPQGQHWGGALDYVFSGTEPEELWAQYDLYLPANTEINGNGKLPGFAGTYGQAGWGGRTSDGTNGWSARGRFDAGESGNTFNVGFYVYHADMSGSSGDPMEWDVDLEMGKWHRIRQHIKLNNPDQKNGVLEGWANGSKAFEKRDVRFRTTSDLKIHRYWFDLYWGGTWTSPKDNRFYFDNFQLSQSALTDGAAASSGGSTGSSNTNNPC